MTYKFQKFCFYNYEIYKIGQFDIAYNTCRIVGGDQCVGKRSRHSSETSAWHKVGIQSLKAPLLLSGQNYMLLTS